MDLATRIRYSMVQHNINMSDIIKLENRKKLYRLQQNNYNKIRYDKFNSFVSK
jgi:hypothetical protein